MRRGRSACGGLLPAPAEQTQSGEAATKKPDSGRKRRNDRIRQLLMSHRSARARAYGIPRNCEEACANVHAHSLATVEGVPEIGLDIYPVRACGGRIGINLDLIPDRTAFWSA